MLNLSKQSAKKLAVIVHDLAMTALAIVFVFAVRFDGWLFDERMRQLPTILPFFVAYAGAVYWFFQLYRSKWRFASLPDLSNIVRAVTVLTLTLLVVGLRARLAEPLRLFLLRQDHHRPLLAGAGRPARRPAPRLSLFQILALQASCGARGDPAGPAARPRRRHRDGDPCHGIGGDGQDAAGRRPLATVR